MASPVRTNNWSSATGNAALYGGLRTLDGLLVPGIAGFLNAASRWRA